MAVSACSVVAAPSTTPACASTKTGGGRRAKKAAYKNMLHLLRRGLSRLSLARDSPRDGSTSSDIEMEDKRIVGNGAVVSTSSSPLRSSEEVRDFSMVVWDFLRDIHNCGNSTDEVPDASELRSSTDSSGGLRTLNEIRAELRALLPPPVYSDPFVVVTADGRIHVLNYFEEPHISNLNRTPDLYAPESRPTMRRIDISRIRALYHARSLESRHISKTWGITANNIWWAADSHRHEWEGDVCNIALEDDSSGLRAGLTVIHVAHFVAALRAVGLPETCRLIAGLPPIPIASRPLPYIDEDEDDTSELETSTRSVRSFRVESPTYAHQILEERASSRLSNASSTRRF